MAEPSLSLAGQLLAKRGEIDGMLKHANHPVEQYKYHLDQGSVENIYWQHGYRSALDDVLLLLEHYDRQAQKAKLGGKGQTEPWTPNKNPLADATGNTPAKDATVSAALAAAADADGTGSKPVPASSRGQARRERVQNQPPVQPLVQPPLPGNVDDPARAQAVRHRPGVREFSPLAPTTPASVKS